MTKKMSARQHIKELQLRLMVGAAFFIVGASLAYSFKDTIIPFLLAPAGQEKLIYLNPAGGFSFVFLISIYAGLALAFPILVQQLYAFLKPALPEKARHHSWKIILGSFALLAAGIAFGYFVAVPSALQFLYTFAEQYIDASLTADSYLNFIIAYTIGIGIVFQLPLLLLLWHTIKPLTPGGLLRSERWVILIAFIVAAIITPTPDPVNQALIAGPVIVIYQIGVVSVLLLIAKERKKSQRATPARVKAPEKPKDPPVAQPKPQVIHTATPLVAPKPLQQAKSFDIIQPPATVVQRPTQQRVTMQERPQQENRTRQAFYIDGITRQRTAQYQAR